MYTYIWTVKGAVQLFFWIFTLMVLDTKLILSQRLSSSKSSKVASHEYDTCNIIRSLDSSSGFSLCLQNVSLH